MGVAFVESNLLFEFGDRWTKVLKWDREPAHAEGMKKVHLGKDVDFVGLLDGKVLFFIEVKDHRDHTRSVERGDIGHEFELKVRSTVAALVGAHRRRYQSCSEFFETLAASRPVRLVLWVEECDETARSKATMYKRRKAWGVTEPRRRKKDVCWLDVDTTELNSFEDYRDDLPDLRVTPLSEERQKKVEGIIEALRRKKEPLPEDARWLIENTVDRELLDRWLELAPTVGSARQLLRR